MFPTTQPDASVQKGTDPSVQAALRQAFTSRKTSHENKSIASTGSRLSGNRLYRARTGSSAVFVRREGISPDRLDVHFVVDASSSMGVPSYTRDAAGQPIFTGTRMSSAQTLTANLVEALLRLPAIRQHVWSFRDSGHTTMLGDVLDTRQGHGVERIRSMQPGGGTPTATAVRAIGERVIAERKPRERSIVIVLTDGQPSEEVAWVRAAVNSAGRPARGRAGSGDQQRADRQPAPVLRGRQRGDLARRLASAGSGVGAGAGSPRLALGRNRGAWRVRPGLPGLTARH